MCRGGCNRPDRAGWVRGTHPPPVILPSQQRLHDDGKAAAERRCPRDEPRVLQLADDECRANVVALSEVIHTGGVQRSWEFQALGEDPRLRHLVDLVLNSRIPNDSDLVDLHDPVAPVAADDVGAFVEQREQHSVDAFPTA